LNAYHGTHALRERARKLDQGILIVRFEMPYNIWCDGCKNHIAQSNRYNAEKKKVDMYFSTPVHEFKMKCHLCDNHFVIRTDPKNLDYVIISGARRKEQRWNMAENEQIVTEEKSDIKRLSIDPMFSLEHEVNDKEKMVKLAPTLRELEEVRKEWKDDYALNTAARNLFRV
jgi:coiled-coil domain-containing protein 130